MKKTYFKFLNALVILCVSLSLASCSDDDDNGGGGIKSTLTVDGKAIKIDDLEAEYDSEHGSGSFLFWVNDVATVGDRVYIQAEFPAKENIAAGTDITSKFEIMFIRDGGNEGFMDNSYRSGKIFVKAIDNNKKTLTIEFQEAKYLSSLKNTITINGILSMPYTIVKYGNDK